VETSEKPRPASTHLDSEALARRVAETMNRVRSNAYIPVEPSARQWAFLSLDVKEALYGGAAGGGKSYALLVAALEHVHVSTYRALLLRRTYSDLNLPDALMDLAKQWLAETDAKPIGGGREWAFPSGARLVFGHLDSENQKYRYQGAAFHFVGFDELTQFTESQYRYLFSRIRRRAAGDASGVPLRMRAATNPGGIGHEWVHDRFFTQQGIAEGRRFIPAKLVDNPHLDADSYRQQLAELDPVTRMQLEEGDLGHPSVRKLLQAERFRAGAGRRVRASAPPDDGARLGPRGDGRRGRLRGRRARELAQRRLEDRGRRQRTVRPGPVREGRAGDGAA